MLPARGIYSRSSKVFFFLFIFPPVRHPKGKEQRDWSRVLLMTRWWLCKSPGPCSFLRQVSTGTAPWRKEEKPVQEERGKPNGEFLSERTSVGYSFHSKAEPTASYVYDLQTYSEYEHSCFDYVEHPQLKT